MKQIDKPVIDSKVLKIILNRKSQIHIEMTKKRRIECVMLSKEEEEEEVRYDNVNSGFFSHKK